MNKQEQSPMKRYIERMRKDLTKFCKAVGCDASLDVPIVEATIERLYNIGYINGADFVEWLRNRVISNKDYPHLAVVLLCDDTREELSEFIDKALQEYLKGE